jgi:hypothetical protein
VNPSLEKCQEVSYKYSSFSLNYHSPLSLNLLWIEVILLKTFNEVLDVRALSQWLIAASVNHRIFISRSLYPTALLHFVEGQYRNLQYSLPADLYWLLGLWLNADFIAVIGSITTWYIFLDYDWRLPGLKWSASNFLSQFLSFGFHYHTSQVGIRRSLLDFQSHFVRPDCLLVHRLAQ